MATQREGGGVRGGAARGWLLLVAGIVLGILAWDAPAAAATKTLRVGYIPISNCIQLFAAMEKGYFTEEGIALSAKSIVGGATLAPAMEAGEVDMGYSNSLTIIIGRDRGFDFQFLVNGALNVEPGHATNSLLVRHDSPIQNVKDLEGKRLALNVLASINELVLKVAAEKFGFDLQKVALQELPFPNMEPALKNNTTDAVVASEPFVTLAVGNGTARPLIKDFYAVVGPRVLIGSWFAKKAWIDKNPELARGFARAMNKATDYLNSNPADRAQILARHTRVKAELAQKIGWAAFSREMLRSDLQPLIDHAKKYGYIKNAFDAAQITGPDVALR